MAKYFGVWEIEEEIPSTDGNTITLYFKPEKGKNDEDVKIYPVDVSVSYYDVSVTDEPVDLSIQQRNRLTPVVKKILEILKDANIFYEEKSGAVFHDIPYIFREVANTVDQYKQLVEDEYMGKPVWQRTLRDLDKKVIDTIK